MYSQTSSRNILKTSASIRNTKRPARNYGALCRAVRKNHILFPSGNHYQQLGPVEHPIGYHGAGDPGNQGHGSRVFRDI